MDYSRINTLLDKYWECATTVAEERELRHFFITQRNIPTDLQPYKAWFLSDQAENLSPLGTDFDSRILEYISQEKMQRYHRRLGYLLGVVLFISCLLLLILYLTPITLFN